MKTVYQVSQKFSTEKETEELLTQEFDNYQDAKDYFEEIKDEMQQGGDIVTDLVKYVYDEAVERVESEVNLKLTNRIDLSNLDLNFVNNED